MKEKNKGGRPRIHSVDYVASAWEYAKRHEPDLSKQSFARQIGYKNGRRVSAILAENRAKLSLAVTTEAEAAKK